MATTSKTILGIDILPMSSSSSKQKPKYAAVIFSGETITFKEEEISFRKLIKIFQKYKPDYLAVDNIWELAPDQVALQSLLRKLPPLTLVQVTGSPSHGMEPIHILAKRAGMQLTSHPSPIQTAEICARLVMIGIGYEAALFEKETEIRISRTRALGPGGWSQNRYRRHSHAAILQATRDIQTQLDEQGFEYDLSVRKADYGLDKSVFTVYSSMDEVMTFIKPYNGSTIQIYLTPIKKKEIEFIPLVAKKEDSLPLHSLIVGIDPGTTTGIAILDLKGKILALRSGKEISRRDLIRYIGNFGTAVLIATDVTVLPKFVEKVANTFNSLIFRPKKLMKVSEKQDIVNDCLRDSKRKVSDAHIRDALACAIKAYYSYLPIFEKINKKVKEMNVDIPIEKIKVLVMRGYSIYDAISILSFKPEEEEVIFKESPQDEATKIEALNSKIFQLIEKNIRLKQQIEDISKNNAKLEDKNKDSKKEIIKLQKEVETARSKTYYRLRGERLIRAQASEINQLRAEVSDLKEKTFQLETEISKFESRTVILEELQQDQLANKIIILKVIDNFSKDCLESVEISPNDVIYLRDGSGGSVSNANQIIAQDISVIITNTLSHAAYEQFRNADIIVLPIKEVQSFLKMRAGVYFVDKKLFEQKLKMFKQKQTELTRQEAEIWLQNLISDYRKRKDVE